ncbi:TetR family transcriptional regulator [Streptomyces sp. NPDC058691]|uniref:TetR family transcriptional regulator n=1 Tax=Streptomyces sp. NPDC058691 TaxID=3346601 RepID=UPI00364D8099
MSHTLGVREAQKQQTRQALLDAGLRLLENQSLSSLGLRAVTREVGVAPAGFYRHFRDMSDLGVALVGESLSSLHTMIQAIMAEQDDAEEVIARTVRLITLHVRAHRPHIRFIARERHGGVTAVREAIAAEMDQFAEEVATALASQPISAGWRGEDVRMLAELYVDRMLMTAIAFMEAPADDPAAEERIERTARKELFLIHLGRRHWLAAQEDGTAPRD